MSICFLFHYQRWAGCSAINFLSLFLNFYCFLKVVCLHHQYIGRAAMYKSPRESVVLLEPRGELVQNPLRKDAACSEGQGAGKLDLPCACCLLRGGRGTDSGEYHSKNTKSGDTSAASAHRGCVRSLMTDPSAGTDVDGRGFWGEGSEIFRCRYHQRKRPSEELKFTQCSRSVYGPRKIYRKNVRCQWIVLNVNIIQLAASVSYCSLARSSRGSPV